MKHPDSTCQKYQEEFLKNCSDEDRELHAKLFRIGNASYVYHQLAFTTSEGILEEYYNEWLQSLPTNISADMEKRGFDACKSMFSFTRYVNERNDYGMQAWMKEHLSESDYEYYLSE